jgi:hypothetical protein
MTNRVVIEQLEARVQIYLNGYVKCLLRHQKKSLALMLDFEQLYK